MGDGLWQHTGAASGWVVARDRLFIGRYDPVTNQWETGTVMSTEQNGLV